jgi:hypothetical protein
MTRASLAVVVGVAVVVLTGCGGSSSVSAPAAGAVAELRSVDQLETAFDADRGKPRLVLLLSPT